MRVDRFVLKVGHSTSRGVITGFDPFKAFERVELILDRIAVACGHKGGPGHRCRGLFSSVNVG